MDIVQKPSAFEMKTVKSMILCMIFDKQRSPVTGQYFVRNPILMNFVYL
jgi:hypothetical protein